MRHILSISSRCLGEVLSAWPADAWMRVSSPSPPPQCHSVAAPRLILAAIRACQAPPRIPLDLQDTETEARKLTVQNQAGGQHLSRDRLSSPVCTAQLGPCLVATRYTHSWHARVRARVAGPFGELAAASPPSRTPPSESAIYVSPHPWCCKDPVPASVSSRGVQGHQGDTAGPSSAASAPRPPPTVLCQTTPVNHGTDLREHAHATKAAGGGAQREQQRRHLSASPTLQLLPVFLHGPSFRSTPRRPANSRDARRPGRGRTAIKPLASCSESLRDHDDNAQRAPSPTELSARAASPPLPACPVPG